MICDRCSDRGMCCRYIELPLARPLTEDERNWVELHNGMVVNGSTIHMNIACSALTEEGLCSLYGTEARPAMCGIWPDAPEVQAPAGCAYLEVK